MRTKGLIAAMALGAIPWLATVRADVELGEPLESETLLSPKAVELADIDGDGILDAVVVGTSISARFACYGGMGDGTFGPEIASGYLFLQPTDLVVDDFDGDGILDIAGINNACSG